MRLLPPPAWANTQGSGSCKDVGGMMAGPQGRAGSPWCIEPAARPGLAKVSPQSRG